MLRDEALRQWHSQWFRWCRVGDDINASNSVGDSIVYAVPATSRETKGRQWSKFQVEDDRVMKMI